MCGSRAPGESAAPDRAIGAVYAPMPVEKSPICDKSTNLEDVGTPFAGMLALAISASASELP